MKIVKMKFGSPGQARHNGVGKPSQTVAQVKGTYCKL